MPFFGVSEMESDMRAVGFALGIVTLSAAVAHAGDSSKLAEKMGAVMAAEEPCSLTYDPEAIKSFIEKQVKADDMDFAGDLHLYTWTSTNSIGTMTASSKIAFCTQEARVAKSFGFIK
jgi:hypothetical protein